MAISLRMSLLEVIDAQPIPPTGSYGLSGYGESNARAIAGSQTHRRQAHEATDDGHAVVVRSCRLRAGPGPDAIRSGQWILPPRAGCRAHGAQGQRNVGSRHATATVPHAPVA